MSDKQANELCYCINSLVSKHRKCQCLNTKIASGFATTFGLEPPPPGLQELWKPITPPASSPRLQITNVTSGNTKKQCRCTETQKFPHRGGKCFYTLSKKNMAACAAAVTKQKPTATPGGIVDISRSSTVPPMAANEPSGPPNITADVSDASTSEAPFDFSSYIFPLLPSVSIPFTFPQLLGLHTAPPLVAQNSGQADGEPTSDAAVLNTSAKHSQEPTQGLGEAPRAAPVDPSARHIDHEGPADGIVADPGELTAAADSIEARVHILMTEVGSVEVPAPPAPVLTPAAALHPALDAALIPQETAMPPLAALPTVMPAPAPEHVPDLAPMPSAVHPLAPPIDTPTEVQVVPNHPLQDDAPPNNDLEDLMAGLMGEWQVPGEELQQSDGEDADNYDDTVTVSGRDVLPEMHRRLQRYEDADDASVFTVRAL
jgi:hypothetical protein